MEKPHHHTSLKRRSAFSNIIHKMKRRDKTNDRFFADKNILQRLFHPDYILFDWEFFSRELEFE